MGQKVNPHGMRVGVIKDWDSRWYAKDEKVGDLIVEDYNIRKFLKKTLYGAGVPRSRSSAPTTSSPCSCTARVRVWSSARTALRSRRSAPRSKP